jgi:hypothetical protein
MSGGRDTVSLGGLQLDGIQFVPARVFTLMWHMSQLCGSDCGSDFGGVFAERRESLLMDFAKAKILKAALRRFTGYWESFLTHKLHSNSLPLSSRVHNPVSVSAPSSVFTETCLVFAGWELLPASTGRSPVTDLFPKAETIFSVFLRVWGLAYS